MLTRFMTATVSTTRPPTISSGSVGDPTAHLTAVKITPIMLPSASGQHTIRQAIGLEGTAVQIYEAYTASHSHTDGGVSVSQLPDITRGDRVIYAGETYLVRWADKQPATSAFGETLLMYLTEDKRR